MSTGLVLSSFNCRNVKSSVNEIRELCNSSDIVLLQETWLSTHDLPFLNAIDERFYSKGVSAMSTDDRVLKGRPHGGLGILWNRNMAHMCKTIEYGDPRILGVEITSATSKILILNVYLPYDNGDNYDDYLYYLHMINNIITDFPSCYSFICGDFNANANSLHVQSTHRFGRELIQFCNDESYILSDVCHNCDDSTFTYFSEMHNTVSWLDHIVSSVSAHSLIDDIWVKYNFVSSDHLPLCLKINLSRVNVDPGGDNSELRQVHRIKWEELSTEDRQLYCDNTDRSFCCFKYDHSLLLCANIHCSEHDHINAIDGMYKDITTNLYNAGISFSKVSKPVFNQVEGWNDYCRQAHMEAREAFLMWRSYNNPKHGPVFEHMKKTRCTFKLIFRKCKSGQLKKSADVLASKFLSKDTKSFWKDIKKITKKEASIASSINGVTGQAKIADMWHFYFKGLLNSSQCTVNKPRVLSAMSDLSEMDSMDRFTSSEIIDAINELKIGKSPGLDGLYAEHYKCAGDKLSFLMAMVINAMFTHSYFPSNIMETVIIPIIKDKRGDVTDKDNYRPIAITNIFSKVIELVLLCRYSSLLVAADNQFGFRNKHSTDMCVFAFQQVIDLYVSLNSPVYICYLDASKAFDRVNHWSLFNKLLKRSVPKLVVRIIIFWYTKQTFTVQWGQCLSVPFTCSNGVRQGGILSPLFFNVYVDELSMHLNNLKTGCNINNIYLNHFMYADDTVLVAPSPVALQKLINCCSQFVLENDMLFNTKKSVCMYVKSKKFNDLVVPNFTLDGKNLRYVDKEKYLGVIMADDSRSDNDINRQMRSIYGRGNIIINNFKHCTDSVKIQLFKTFCCNFYCSHLWSVYNKASYSKVKVAFKKIYRTLMNLERRCSITNHMVNLNVDSFDVLIRKSVYSFRERLIRSDNVLISTVVNSMFFLESPLYARWLKVLF